MQRYGVEAPAQNQAIKDKMMLTKVTNGGFTASNSSKAATEFIKTYIKDNGYDVSQCAYADNDIGLFEWGTYYNGRWVLYDLVVFEQGFRGDKDKVLEILEYHGPFHYTIEEVLANGNEKAYPWKSNHTTIRESFERDNEKRELGKTMTCNYTEIWTRKKP